MYKCCFNSTRLSARGSAGFLRRATHSRTPILNADCSDAFLECSHWQRLHNRLGWLGLHHHLLAEDHLLPSLCRWLLASLDLANTWDDEFAVTFHTFRGDGCKAGDHLGQYGLLQAILL